MPIIHLPNGLGESLGDNLASEKPIEVQNNVWYVSSASGIDAVSPAGQNRTAPLLTVGQAVTNAASGDVIVLAADHNETITATIVANKNLTIVGSGKSLGYPTAKLTNNQAAGTIFAVTAANFFHLRNIWFCAEAQANADGKVTLASATGTHQITDCYFECSTLDDGPAVQLGSVSCIIRNTTFKSTPGINIAALRPHSALSSVVGPASFRSLIMDGVVLDGNVAGWSSYFALNLSIGTYPSSIAIENLSLLNGSDVRIHSSAVGYINVSTNTGGCRVDWDGVV